VRACAALGCKKGVAKGRDFCVGHVRKLTEELRAAPPHRLRDQVVYLGVVDGRLAPDPTRRRPVVYEVEGGQEYV